MHPAADRPGRASGRHHHGLSERGFASPATLARFPSRCSRNGHGSQVAPAQRKHSALVRSGAAVLSAMLSNSADFERATMKSYNIALIPGDGTGPEVLAEGVKVL